MSFVFEMRSSSASQLCDQTFDKRSTVSTGGGYLDLMGRRNMRKGHAPLDSTHLLRRDGPRQWIGRLGNALSQYPPRVQRISDAGGTEGQITG